MKCPKCLFENPQDVNFCVNCGNKLEMICIKCGSSNSLAFNFCGQCGYDLIESTESAPLEANEHLTQISESPPEETLPTPILAEGERKHVTALFSDLSGYTAMSERLDPEEVKEITSQIFNEISKIVVKYNGFIEKYAGDAVMALFGVPTAHEDDPIRAIKVAREIHEMVDRISPEVESRIGQPISMHTGINTGLVVTGDVDTEKGTHGVAGHTINLASRLGSLAKAGEILVSADTYLLAEGHYAFESLEPTLVKGKSEPVQIHKVISPKKRPISVHRLSGLRADLIGRRAEMDQLGEAVEQLREGRGRIFSICGDAGTGKSRLIEEFKAICDLEEIQWMEGHAYAYSQNIPYFPLMDLLNKELQIEEADPPEKIREKIELGIENLVDKKEDVIPYVGGLYALSYPEVEGVSPEFWKPRLQDSVNKILSALARRAPTVFCLEDLHWADPSFVELLRNALLKVPTPAIVLCVYRPIFSLFTSHQLGGLAKIYHEIRLKDLSSSEAQDMLESLLKSEMIPTDLRRFVQNKAEGNPFYLEELVNSLIESETLIRDNESWIVAKPINEADISSTIHGLITGRLDRLETKTKRVLREASVIGRAFLYEILRRITELEESVDLCLRGLELLDIIRAKSLQPDLEYVFKHALIQEVAYSGLLRRERGEIHERIALTMESLFRERLPEFYETLAFHFSMGQSLRKAVEYLVRSGEKSLRKYALEESNQYFKEAFNILSKKPTKTKDDDLLLIDLLTKWCRVFHYRGEYSRLIDLFKSHENMAQSLQGKAEIGMFYAYLGHALNCTENLKDSYRYLRRALELAEDIENHRVIGYTCARLARTCADLGLLDDAVEFAKRAREISKLHQSDEELFITSLGEIGMVHYFRGDCKKVDDVGKIFLEQGQRYSNPRYITYGYLNRGYGHMTAGNLPAAIESFQQMIEFSLDPMMFYVARTLLGLAYVAEGETEKAERVLEEMMTLEDITFEALGTPAKAFQGIVLIAKGQMSKGIRMVEDVLQKFLETGSRYRYALTSLLLGRVHLRLVQRTGPRSLSLIAKNIGFLVRNVPFASKKAENHLKRSIEVAKEIGAKSVLGQAYLYLGLLHSAKERKEMAKECISNAIRLFKQCEAEVYLKQANEALASLR